MICVQLLASECARKPLAQSALHLALFFHLQKEGNKVEIYNELQRREFASEESAWHVMVKQRK
jgi:hypothetical protein